jgi:trimeric autotransporter adhesin
MKKISLLLFLAGIICSAVSCTTNAGTSSSSPSVSSSSSSSATSAIVGTWVANQTATYQYKYIFNSDGTYTTYSNTNSAGFVLGETGTYTYNSKVLTTIRNAGTNGALTVTQTTVTTSVGVSGTKMVFGATGGNTADLTGTWSGSRVSTYQNLPSGTSSDSTITSSAVISGSSFNYSYSETGSATATATITGINTSSGTLTISGTNNSSLISDGSKYFVIADGVLSQLSDSSTIMFGVFTKQ